MAAFTLYRDPFWNRYIIGIDKPCVNTGPWESGTEWICYLVLNGSTYECDPIWNCTVPVSNRSLVNPCYSGSNPKWIWTYPIPYKRSLYSINRGKKWFSAVLLLCDNPFFQKFLVSFGWFLFHFCKKLCLFVILSTFWIKLPVPSVGGGGQFEFCSILMSTRQKWHHMTWLNWSNSYF